jgi:hypothetical protein
MMNNQINHAELETAVEALVQSDKGKQTAIDLLAMLERGAISLDEQNQDAVQTILAGAWGGFSGTALDVLRDHIGD